jgi:hypothetical protein
VLWRAGNLVSLFDTTIAARESTYLVTEPEGRLNLRTQVFVEHLQRAGAAGRIAGHTRTKLK